MSRFPVWVGGGGVALRGSGSLGGGGFGAGGGASGGEGGAAATSDTMRWFISRILVGVTLEYSGMHRWPVSEPFERHQHAHRTLARARENYYTIM